MFQIEEVFTDLSNADYHSHGAKIISSSYLKNVYKHSIDKASMPMGSSPALEFGSAFHDVMELGIEEWNKIYAVAPDVDKRTTVYKDFAKENLGKVCLSGGDSEKIMRMRDSVESNEFFKYLNSTYESHKEWSFFGRYNDIRCRVRPDVCYSDISKATGIDPIKRDIKVAIDYKTCQDVTLFKYDLKKYAYDLQAVYYSDFLGIDPTNFYFVAVEKTYPYTTQVFRLSESSISLGRMKMEQAFARVKSNDRGIGYELVEEI
jgi:hypothetical protein